jgi:hypothetical protein
VQLPDCSKIASRSLSVVVVGDTVADEPEKVSTSAEVTGVSSALQAASSVPARRFPGLRRPGGG